MKLKMPFKIVKQSSLIIYLLLIVCIQGCTDPHFLDVDEVTSKISGRVTGNGGFSEIPDSNAGIAGAAVRVARFRLDGSLQMISANAVLTDASGNFTIETALNNESELVIIAEKNTLQWKSVVSSKVKKGITVFCQPLNDETTAEADIYSLAKSKQGLISYFEVAEYINARVASQLIDSELASEVTASLINQSDAMREAFTSPGMGGSEGAWNVITLAMKDAQAVLERNLNFAFSKSAVDAAFQSYYNAAVSVYVNSGFPGETFVKLLEISNQIFGRNNYLDAELKFELEKRIASLKAHTMDIAVRSQFSQIISSPDQINKIISAGETFKIHLETSLSTEEINYNFSNYNVQIRDELENVLGIYGNLLSGADSVVLSYKTELKNTLNSAVSDENIIDAYINFYLQVRISVLSVLDAAESKQKTAAAEIFVITNLYDI